MLENRLAQHEKDPENEKTRLTEEQIEQINKHITDTKEELVELSKLYEDEKLALKEENPFASFIAKAFEETPQKSSEEETVTQVEL